MFKTIKNYLLSLPHRIVEAFSEAGSILQYVRDRLSEPSTWGSIGVSISAAAVLPWPWPLASLICGLMVALIPNKPKV